jgi:hypothetical protein
MANSYDIPIGTTGKAKISILQPPNNGVIYTLGVWPKNGSDWEVGPHSGVVMPGDDIPDEFNLGRVGDLHGDFLCLAAKLIPLEDTDDEKYRVVFEIETDAGTHRYKSKQYDSPQQVDLVYLFTDEVPE